MTAWIEAASPFPWVGVKRVAHAPCNRPDASIAVIDVPAIGPFGVSAAGLAVRVTGSFEVICLPERTDY
jgi:hypothetical protein